MNTYPLIRDMSYLLNIEHFLVIVTSSRDTVVCMAARVPILKQRIRKIVIKKA